MLKIIKPDPASPGREDLQGEQAEGLGAAALPSADGNGTADLQPPAQSNQREGARLCWYTPAMSSFFPASDFSFTNSGRFSPRCHSADALFLAATHSDSRCRPTGEHQGEEGGSGSSRPTHAIVPVFQVTRRCLCLAFRAGKWGQHQG